MRDALEELLIRRDCQSATECGTRGAPGIAMSANGWQEIYQLERSADGLTERISSSYGFGCVFTY